MRLSDQLSSGRAACLNSNLIQAREETKNKVGQLADRETENLSSPTRPGNVVFEEVNHTITQCYERIPRKSTGQAILLRTLISGLSPMIQSSSFSILSQPTSTKHQPQQTAPQLSPLLLHRSSRQNERCDIAMLHRTHVDLFALRFKRRTQIVLRSGECEIDNALHVSFR